MKRRKKSKKYVKIVKAAYSLLVEYRKKCDDKDPEYAAYIESIYKNLWCECINEPAPWK